MPEEESIFDENKGDNLEISQDEKEQVSGYSMSSGKELNNTELYRLASKEKTYIIYVLGPTGSGKTTFETMMYEQFFSRIDDDLLFSGSKTLIAYEDRLKYIRVNNGNAEVDMPRTGENDRYSYLHMKLYSISKEKYYNIIFVDSSGENYEKCKSNVEKLELEYPYIDIASSVLLFINGEEICNKSLRNIAKQNVIVTLETIKSSNLYNKDININIVISKNDFLINHIDEGNTQQFIEKMYDDIKRYNEYYKIKIHRIESLSNDNLKDQNNSITLSGFLKELISIRINDDSLPKTDIEDTTLKSEFNKYNRRCKYE